MLGSEASRNSIPCWPNPSRLTVALTKEIDRLTGDLLFQMIFVVAALFALHDVLGKGLHFAGLRHLILFQGQYAYVAGRIPGTKVVDFQLLEIVAFFSIALGEREFSSGSSI